MPAALDDLDEEQRAAATALTGPVCIIAGAGTGKTRTVTHRVAYGVATGEVGPRRALAITHSRKAAAELGERLSRLGVSGVDARTFHAAGLRVVKDHWALTGRPEPSPIVLPDNEEWRLWRDALRSALGQEPDNAELRDVIDEVGWARSQLVGVDDYPAAAMLAGRRPGVDASSVVRCWERFNSAKARIGKVDFADLLEIASRLIEGEELVAGAVRARWAHVTVDEYQDTDPAQQRLLDAILGDGRDVCVVGDPRQAIYSFKGADPVYLTGFTRRYPDARVFNLTRNYRSSPQILDWANRVAVGGRTKPLVATRDAGARPKVTQLDDEQAEAAWVAGAARRAIASGVPPSEIAVLYRFNSTQARFEAAFARADIAVVVAEDTTFFDREEVRAVLVPYGREARAQPERNGLELLSSLLARAGFDRDKPPSGLGAARARWESQQALVELVEALPGAPPRPPRRCWPRSTR
jgi:DNA helicase-2/ATP-dependent DNA helicase PcrA